MERGWEKGEGKCRKGRAPNSTVEITVDGDPEHTP